MSRNEDLDLLLDAVCDHMDIAHQSGCPARDVAAVTMQAVGLFLLAELSVDQMVAVMRASCDDLAAAMPVAGDPDAKH